MVNFLLKVVLRADELSGPVVETSHYTSLHVGRMMGLEVEIPVRVRGLPVDRDTCHRRMLMTCGDGYVGS